MAAAVLTTIATIQKVMSSKDHESVLNVVVFAFYQDRIIQVLVLTRHKAFEDCKLKSESGLLERSGQLSAKRLWLSSNFFALWRLRVRLISPNDAKLSKAPSTLRSAGALQNGQFAIFILQFSLFNPHCLQAKLKN